MKRKLFSMAGVLAVLLALSSCATYSTKDGVSTPLGALTFASINKSRTVVAEYSIICGLFTLAYQEFLRKTSGKDIDIVDVNYFGVYRKVQAVAR
jgi:hypothetical protein